MRQQPSERQRRRDVNRQLRLGYSDSLAMLGNSQKSGAGEPAYLRWINRPLGRRAAAVASSLGANPNQVTILSGVSSMLGIGILCTGWSSIIAAIGCSLLLLLGYVLDSADGQLARLTGRGSAAGEWLDHVVDAVRLPAFHVAVAISLSVRIDAEFQWPVYVALAFSVVSSVWFFASTLGGKLIPQQQVTPESAAAPLWISFVKAPLDIAFLYFILLLLPAYGVFVALYAVTFMLSVLAALASLRRKFRLLSTANPQGAN